MSFHENLELMVKGNPQLESIHKEYILSAAKAIDCMLASQDKETCQYLITAIKSSSEILHQYNKKHLGLMKVL